VKKTSDGATTIFASFVGATLPQPTPGTCDPMKGVSVKTSGVVLFFANPCLNETPIPDAKPTDPQFLVKAEGSTTETTSPTITFQDKAAGSTSKARLNKTWFITEVNGSTVQRLGVTYADWDGKQQNAWLVGNPTDGYGFLNVSPPSDASIEVSPDTCVADKYCSSATEIKYVGADGKHYSASVKAFAPTAGEDRTTPAVTNSHRLSPGSKVKCAVTSFDPVMLTVTGFVDPMMSPDHSRNGRPASATAANSTGALGA